MLSFLLFYGLMVGKYALICAMEIQKIHVVVHFFSGFALFTESECIAELNPSASCRPLTRCILINTGLTDKSYFSSQPAFIPGVKNLHTRKTSNGSILIG